MTAPTEVTVPDIGDFGVVPVIEVHVSAGDQVNAEDPLVTLESDKATMDIPAPLAGEVAEVLVKVGDEVSQGSPLLLLTPGSGAVSAPPSLVEQQEPAPASAPAAVPAPSAPAAPAAGGVDTPAGVHAGPSVRRTARELGVDLAAVTPTGPKGRITKDDRCGS
jgi:pyruvate dehydrogenase E2 component (dihydrolipoamide acetyltransferase)